MNTRFRNFVSVVALIGCMPLAGCVNPYDGVDTGYMTYNRPLTAQDVRYQDDVVKPRCRDWAQGVSPSKLKMMAVVALNTGVGGFLGGAAGYAADAEIIGAVNTASATLGAGTYYMLAATFQGAAAGALQHDASVHAYTIWCQASEAAGFHFYSQKYGQMLLVRAQPGQQAPSIGSDVEVDRSGAVMSVPDRRSKDPSLPPPPPSMN